MERLIIPILAITFIVTGCNTDTQKIENDGEKIIKVEYEENGYLKQNIVEDIRDEQLRIKAISAHEYSLPTVAVEQWRRGLLSEADYGDWVIYKTRESKLPILTANATTPYVVTPVDLAKSSYYIEIPASSAEEGVIGGIIFDIYQSPAADLGILGPDQGKGGKYLLVGPESEIPADHSADYVVRSSSNLNILGTRIIGKLSEEVFDKTLKKHKVYKVVDSGDNQKFVFASDNPDWFGCQPRGIAYWEYLNAVLQNEPVVDRNRFILTQLRGTGIEKGKEFNPTEKQKEILIKAEDMGNAIAMVNTFSKVSYKERHWKDRNWLYILNMQHLDHMHPNYYEVKEIGSYTYEAMSTSKGMILNSRGKGSKYLGAYVDENKEWLDGKNTYQIIIPKDAPASQFWSLTVYDNDTRCLIINDQKKSDLSSVMEGLKVEADGSTKVFVGPKAPEGYENNWIQSNPEKGFFVYLRLYGPLEPYYDKSWKMPDIKKIIY